MTAVPMLRDAADVAYEASASLGLVSAAVQDLKREGEAIDQTAEMLLDDLATRPGGLSALVRTLTQAVHETTDLLSRLRQSRNMLERAAVDRLSQMQAKLKEVSTATELAATDLLDGMDRVGALVDELDASDDAERRKALAGQIRDEMFNMTVAMQFQDITTQQLAFASSTISQVEERLGRLVELLAPFSLDGDPTLGADSLVVSTTAEHPVAAPVAPSTFDPHATVDEASTRQALADQLFGAPK